MEIQQIHLKREYISYENVFVITDFSAVGDGRTDCTAAIQSAPDAAAGFKYIDYSFGCDFAGKTGLHCDNWQKNADRLLKLADERRLKFVQAHSPLGRPLLKACWDVDLGNLQELPQHEALKILGDNVRALHIQDNMGNDDHHTFPYTGTLNFDSIMHGLQDINYKGYFPFEADNMPSSPARRRKFEADTRCLRLPLEFRKRYETILYDIGKFILTQYNYFEEN